MMSDVSAFVAATAATWPPAALHPAGAFVVGEGQGGGQRVSSARFIGDRFDPADIGRAVAGLASLGQRPSFAVFDTDPPALDTALAADYAMGDRVVLMARTLSPDGHAQEGSVPDAFTSDTFTLDVFAAESPIPSTPLCTLTAHWPPTPAQIALWQAAGIGPARLAVMHRAPAPRAALAVQMAGRLAGCAFAAISNGIAVLHALEVAPANRRQGLGRRLMQAAAHWARAQGAGHLALLVVETNAPARALYDGLGYAPVTAMHYRIGAPA